MERVRKRFQGITNIMRFNWHFYVLSALLLLCLLILAITISSPYNLYINGLAVVITLSIGVSLLVSFYIYDLSDLYSLSWLKFTENSHPQFIVNIHAGFDETSALLQAQFPTAQLHVFDFYNPALHTEVSIKRARKAYPPYPGTESINTLAIPLQDKTADYVFLILSAHEIRSDTERIAFFRELNRTLKPSGEIIVIEHLRDILNFLAYNIGFMHFLPKSSWMTTFTKAAFSISYTQKVTPFITTFVLQKDGTTA